jgi:hypothetical protein
MYTPLSEFQSGARRKPISLKLIMRLKGLIKFSQKIFEKKFFGENIFFCNFQNSSEDQI